MQLIWEEFLKIVKEEAGSQVVETWFKAVFLKLWDPITKKIVLLMPNQFVSKWVQEHYFNIIKINLSRLLSTDHLDIVFTCNWDNKNDDKNIDSNNIFKRDIIPASPIIINNKQENPENKKNIILSNKLELPVCKTNIKSSITLNPLYKFDTFIVGPNNSLAHAAAWAVCQNLGKAYNPFFIYGGTGLGKTHLLHSIGNEIKKNKPGNVVCYETTDRFTNEFINSIRFDKTQLFRDKYQKIDLLLLDDIQFLSNKEQTQEVFFHIFNTLYENSKQIVLSSDTFPQEIIGLQKRLKSRLEWGLVADIQFPDLETKIAILKKKAELHNINLSEEVSVFIASKVNSNIRELEGALIRVGAFGTLTNQPINLELAKRVLLHVDEKKKDGVMFDSILKTVAKNFSISILDLKSKKRNKDIVTVRQISFYLMKKMTYCSLQSIGEYLGNRDHSTVLHAICKIEDMLKDPAFVQKIKNIEQQILSS